MSNPSELPDLDREKLRVHAFRIFEQRHWVTDEALDGLVSYIEDVAAARRSQPEGEAPHWGPVRTVGDLVRNLMVLEQDASIVTAFHVELEGKRRCRAQQGVTISKERVIDGRWIDSSRKDVPHAYVLWAKPDERAPAATLSPLCGAQPAESGKEVAVLTNDGAEPDWSSYAVAEEAQQAAAPTHCDPAEGFCAKCRAGEHAAQQAAAPGNSPEIPDGSTSAPGTPEAPDTRRLALLLRSDGYRFELLNQQQHLLDPRGRIVGTGITKRDAIDDALGIPRAAQLDGGQEGSESNG